MTYASLKKTLKLLWGRSKQSRQIALDLTDARRACFRDRQCNDVVWLSETDAHASILGSAVPMPR